MTTPPPQKKSLVHSCGVLFERTFTFGCLEGRCLKREKAEKKWEREISLPLYSQRNVLLLPLLLLVPIPLSFPALTPYYRFTLPPIHLHPLFIPSPSSSPPCFAASPLHPPFRRFFLYCPSIAHLGFPFVFSLFCTISFSSCSSSSSSSSSSPIFSVSFYDVAVFVKVARICAGFVLPSVSHCFCRGQRNP